MRICALAALVVTAASTSVAQADHWRGPRHCVPPPVVCAPAPCPPGYYGPVVVYQQPVVVYRQPVCQPVVVYERPCPPPRRVHHRRFDDCGPRRSHHGWEASFRVRVGGRW